MNLNNLKPAWRQFQLLNSMQPIDQEEILLMIEGADRHTIKGLLPRFMTNTIMFIILIVCCQGG